MKSEELRQFAETIAAMSVDYLMGRITADTYVQNLKMFAERL